VTRPSTVRSPSPCLHGAEACNPFWTTKELDSERLPGGHVVHSPQVGGAVREPDQESEYTHFGPMANRPKLTPVQVLQRLQRRVEKAH
jgi:hypothetical protein